MRRGRGRPTKINKIIIKGDIVALIFISDIALNKEWQKKLHVIDHIELEPKAFMNHKKRI